MTLAVGPQVSVTSGESGYWLLDETKNDVHSAQLAHHDTTTAGTWSLYSSNQRDPVTPAATSTPDPEVWSDEGLTITSPAGGAVGSTMLHLSASGAKAYLIRFAATANSELSVHTHGKD